MGKTSSKCFRSPDEGYIFDPEYTPSYSDDPCMNTEQWLRRLRLKEYTNIFKSYNGVEDILCLSEKDLMSLGIKKLSHRNKIMTSLIILRDKYDRGNKIVSRARTAPSSLQHSLAPSTESLLSIPCLGGRRISFPESKRASKMEPMIGTEASPEDLKKALEWELTLDNSDLRSHAWYHGTIPRPRAEDLMVEEGDFLIRDCISRPGDYVLTCSWKGTMLHFVINKVVLQPYTVYERIQYQFEDDCFDTVPDLVTYYVGNRRPVSAASGAVVSRPVNRSMPLSYYATRYGLQCQMHYAALALEKVADGQAEESGEGPLERRLSQPTDVEKGRAESVGSSTMPRPSDHPRKSLPNFSTLQHGSGIQIRRENSSGQLTKKEPKYKSSQESVSDVNNKEETKNEAPPPKPSRVPSKKYGTSPYSSDASKSGNAPLPHPHFYSELNFMNKALNGNAQHLQTNNRKSNQSCTNLKFDQDKEHSSLCRETTIPDNNPKSSFGLEHFTTTLLPSDNKPLDTQALAKIRCMILEGGARIIASHLTRVDLDVLKLNNSEDLGLGVLTGFELLVLPQGQQMRLDLMERIDCLKYFVAITILTCGDDDSRAQLLNKWIQIATETKTALGNLYGFTGIMQGLALGQIARLRLTWLKLRQSYTENAFMYETKLRPTLKNMQECSNPQAPNTCIPHLLSLIDILQKHLDFLPEQLSIEENEDKSQEGLSLSSTHKEKGKVLTLGLQWEQTSSDYGLQLLLTHLEAGRAITQQWPAYKRNGEIALEQVKCDDLLLDAFRTEFHMRFLWGCKGCKVSAKERYGKFEQVLDVMSERCEPN